MDKNIPPPTARIYVRRLSESLTEIKPGFSVLLDIKTARCLRGYGRREKWKMTQRSEGAFMRVWRLEDKEKGGGHE